MNLYGEHLHLLYFITKKSNNKNNNSNRVYNIWMKILPLVSRFVFFLNLFFLKLLKLMSRFPVAIVELKIVVHKIIFIWFHHTKRESVHKRFFLLTIHSKFVQKQNIGDFSFGVFIKYYLRLKTID